MDCKALKKLITQNKRDLKKAQKALEKSINDLEKCKKKEAIKKACAKACAKAKAKVVAPKKGKKTTVTDKRANCKRDGKVYDLNTKECREKITRKKASGKRNASKRKPKFIAVDPIPIHPKHPKDDSDLEVPGRTNTEIDSLVENGLESGRFVPGDLLYVGGMDFSENSDGDGRTFSFVRVSSFPHKEWDKKKKIHVTRSWELYEDITDAFWFLHQVPKHKAIREFAEVGRKQYRRLYRYAHATEKDLYVIPSWSNKDYPWRVPITKAVGIGLYNWIYENKEMEDYVGSYNKRKRVR